MVAHSSVLAWRIPMDRGAWWATGHGVRESDMTERLSTQTMFQSVELLNLTILTFCIIISLLFFLKKV